MDVNLRGAYFASQTVAKAMIADGRHGSIINISSQMAVVGGIDRAVYCASKHAVEGSPNRWPSSLALPDPGKHDLPDFLRTPLTEQTFSQPARVMDEEKIKPDVSARSRTSWARLVPRVRSSALVTGTALLIDGGWTAD